MKILGIILILPVVLFILGILLVIIYDLHYLSWKYKSPNIVGLCISLDVSILMVIGIIILTYPFA